MARMQKGKSRKDLRVKGSKPTTDSKVKMAIAGDKSARFNSNFANHSNYAVHNVASLAFSTNAADVFDTNVTCAKGKLYETASAGVCAVNFIPSIGATGAPTTEEGINPESAVNTLSQKLYTWVRHENSGHANYEPTDLMMYVLGVAQLHVFHAYMVRIYGSLNQYRTFNRYYPDAILRGMGVKNVEQWTQAMPAFRSYMHMFALRTNTHKIPDLPYIHDLTSMVSSLYKDEDSERAQVFFYTPEGFFMYDEKEEAGGASSLKWTSIPSAGFANLDELMAYGNKLQAAICNSEDAGIMSGDILKAMNTLDVANIEIAPDYWVEPEYNPQMLQLFRNTMLMGIPLFDTDVTQVKRGLNTFIKYNPVCFGGDLPKKATYGANFNRYPKIIVDHDNVSDEEVMFLSTFIPEFEPAGVTSTGTHMRILSSGLAIATTAKIYTYRREITIGTDGVITRGTKELDVEYFYSLNYSKLDSYLKGVYEGKYATFIQTILPSLDDFKAYPIVLFNLYDSKCLISCSQEFREFDTCANITADFVRGVNNVRIYSAFDLM